MLLSLLVLLADAARYLLVNPGFGGVQPHGASGVCFDVTSDACDGGLPRLNAILRNLSAGEKPFVFAPADYGSVLSWGHPTQPYALWSTMMKLDALIVRDPALYTLPLATLRPLASAIFADNAARPLFTNARVDPSNPLAVLQVRNVEYNATDGHYITLSCLPSIGSSAEVAFADGCLHLPRMLAVDIPAVGLSPIIVVVAARDPDAPEWAALKNAGWADVVILPPPLYSAAGTSASAVGVQVSVVPVADDDGTTRRVWTISPPTGPHVLELVLAEQADASTAVVSATAYPATAAAVAASGLAAGAAYAADVARTQFVVNELAAAMAAPLATSPVPLEIPFGASGCVEECAGVELAGRAMLARFPSATIALVPPLAALPTTAAGWAAGPVTARDVVLTIVGQDQLCTTQVRGGDLWQLANRSAAYLPPYAQKWTIKGTIVHMVGARLTYSTTLPAYPTRLTSFGIFSQSRGVYLPVNRSQLYTVVLPAVIATNPLYQDIWRAPAESYTISSFTVASPAGSYGALPCGAGVTLQQAAVAFVAAAPGGVVPAAALTPSGYLATSTGAAMAAEVLVPRPSLCAAGLRWRRFEEDCVACESGFAVDETGTTCLLLPPPPPLNVALVAAPVPIGAILLFGALAAGVVWLRRRRAGRVVETRPPPSGCVAMVFTDVQDSTALWEVLGPAFGEALTVHNCVMRECAVRHAGYEVKTEGDAFFFTFDTAAAAFSWCVDAQSSLLAANWPQSLLDVLEERGMGAGSDAPGSWRGLRVRMGVHVGEPLCQRNPVTGLMDYTGMPVNVAARVQAMGRGGQILCSSLALLALLPAAADPVVQDLPSDAPPPPDASEAGLPRACLAATEAVGAALGARFVPEGVHKLRGFEQAIPIAGCVPVALEGRTFPRVGAQGGVMVGAADKLRVRGHRRAPRVVAPIAPRPSSSHSRHSGLPTVPSRLGLGERGSSGAVAPETVTPGGRVQRQISVHGLAVQSFGSLPSPSASVQAKSSVGRTSFVSIPAAPSTL